MLPLHIETKGVSVAQPVEHHTFNVGVLGSNPSWNTLRVSGQSTAYASAVFLCA